MPLPQSAAAGPGTGGRPHLLLPPECRAQFGCAAPKDVGQALLRFAERLRAAPEATGGRARRSAPRQGEDAEARLGTSQRKVLAAVRGAGEHEMTSHEAAKKTGLQNTNAPRILQSLADRGLLTATGESPVIWRADHGDEAVDASAS